MPRPGSEHGRSTSTSTRRRTTGPGWRSRRSTAQWRNTDSGKAGVVCMVCHSLAETRNTPYPQLRASRPGRQRVRARAGPQSPRAARQGTADPRHRRRAGPAAIAVSDTASAAAAYRLSPHAIGFPERLGPLLSPLRPPERDQYLSRRLQASRRWPSPWRRRSTRAIGRCSRHAAEFCSTCHDVTNPLTIKNARRQMGRRLPDRAYVCGVGEQPVRGPAREPELRSRPTSATARPATCSRTTGSRAPRRRSTSDGAPVAAAAADPSRPTVRRGPTSAITSSAATPTSPRLIGASLDETGNVGAVSRALDVQFLVGRRDGASTRNAYWLNAGPPRRARASRPAWRGIACATCSIWISPVRRPRAAGQSAPIAVTVANTGSGHNFPTGFPEGRIAWLAVTAFDLATGTELPIHDSVWNRTSLGVGRFTTADTIDPGIPAVRMEGAGRFARSVRVSVQGGRDARRRLSDARAGVRGPAQSRHECERAADRRARRRHRQEQSTGLPIFRI